MIDKTQLLGLYIGQMVEIPYCIGVFTAVGRDHLHILGMGNKRFNIDDCKLILRKFSDMTEEETKRYDYIKICIENTSPFVFVQQLEYLISIGICINEEWVKKGWVIYKSSLKGDKSHD